MEQRWKRLEWAHQKLLFIVFGQKRIDSSRCLETKKKLIQKVFMLDTVAAVNCLHLIRLLDVLVQNLLAHLTFWLHLYSFWSVLVKVCMCVCVIGVHDEIKLTVATERIEVLIFATPRRELYLEVTRLCLLMLYYLRVDRSWYEKSCSYTKITYW